MSVPQSTTTNKKIVLAYSGGLDTTYAIGYLKKTYECQVIALLIDLGESKNLQELETRALHAGASRCYIVDGRKELAEKYLSVALQSNALYEGAYPLISALSRVLISIYLVKYAQKEKAFAVAHGCTAKGNDQVRFDLSIRVLAPELKVIAPLREKPVDRNSAIAYMQEHNIDIPITRDNPYSIDKNIWGRSCECGQLEDPWTEPPQDAYELTKDSKDASDTPVYVEIGFEEGLPITLDGKKCSFVDIIEYVSKVGGDHGVGRIDHLENRVVGIKSREIYEAPAALILIHAHKSLEGLCLTKDLLHYKQSIDTKIATMIYEGLWFSPLFDALLGFVRASQTYVTGTVRMKLLKGNAIVVGRKSPYSLYDFRLSTYNPEDMFDHSSAAGFIKLTGLPLEIFAHAHSHVSDTRIDEE